MPSTEVESKEAGSPQPPGGRRSTAALVLLLLTGLSWGIYSQVTTFDFVTFDDDRLVTQHPVISLGLSAESIRWAFGAVVWGNWTPLAWISHMLDVSWYGLDASGHHRTNLFLHVINTLLLFGWLRAVTHATWRSAFVAALFSAHPLHVESVAWISERRDLLSTTFGILTLWSYCRWVGGRRVFDYAATLLCLALGLMSKPMLVSLPLLFLLLDFWPLQRFALGAEQTRTFARQLGALVLEKLPFLVMVIAVSAVALFSQAEDAAITEVAHLPLAPRVANAVMALVLYLGKTVWPTSMAVFYPHPNLPGGPEPWTLIQWGPALVFLLAVSSGLLLRRRLPYAITGWFWYLVTLVPVLGLVQVGEQAMADRYTYLPLIGIFIALSWGVGDWAERGAGWLRPVLVGGCALVTLACAIVSWHQVAHWRDSFSLFQHAVAVTEGNFTLHYNLAIEYKKVGRPDEAIDHFRRALEIHPQMSRAHLNLANTLRDQGRRDAAIEHYAAAARTGDDPRALWGLAGVGFERDGNYDAFVAYQTDLRDTHPDSPDAHMLLGHAQRMNGDLDAAIDAYRKALELAPNHAGLEAALVEVLRERESASRVQPPEPTPVTPPPPTLR